MLNILTTLPNIGNTLAQKLHTIGINSIDKFNELSTEEIVIQLSKLENSGVCYNMMYALEGAKQGIRWHGISDDRKKELRDFFNETIKLV